MVDVKLIGMLIDMYCECHRHRFSFNIGETAEELAFENWHEDFEVATREPFREFINDVYSESLGEHGISLLIYVYR